MIRLGRRGREFGLAPAPANGLALAGAGMFGALGARAPASPSGPGAHSGAAASRGPSAGGLRRAVFIDKDGTLVDDVPYNVDPAQVRFTPGALDALRLLDAAGYALVVVTNQSGLATGRFTRQQFARLREAVQRRVREEAGVELLDWFACPHAPAADGMPACLCRKPAPGLLRQAARVHGLALGASWMVGDILDDIEAGQRAGCRTVLLDVGHETVWRTTPLRAPHHRCLRLDEAAAHILALQPPPVSLAA